MADPKAPKLLAPDAPAPKVAAAPSEDVVTAPEIVIPPPAPQEPERIVETDPEPVWEHPFPPPPVPPTGLLDDYTKAVVAWAVDRFAEVYEAATK